MKKILPLFLMAASLAANAQTKVLTQAIITTKTTIVSPEGDEANVPPPPPGADGEQRVTFRFGGDGETKTVTTLKGDLIKTFSESEMGRTTIIRDNANKKTTTLMEMMGNKTGFYSTDEEQEQMRKRMDSMMQSRPQGQGGNNFGAAGTSTTTITYVDESKKIAGQQCKKALLITTRANGNKDTGVVWYCPDFKLQGLPSTGGVSGFGAFTRTNTLGGLSDLAGFPMQYEMKMNRGRVMTVEITKIIIDKEIAVKEFDIPKDFVVKSMKDMQNGVGGGGFQIRMDGGPRN
jgi:hypothetical protein